MSDWMPTPTQAKALMRTDYEILFGGARGGGKSDAGMAWLLYDIHNPLLRCLVIRKNSDDLKDWVDRATRMYARCGAVVTGSPATITFPSGALIRTGHLKDDKAYTKYQGHEYHRILIEELTQIPREQNYLMLISSCRSTVPGIAPQTFSTTNPGGSGHCVPFGEVLTQNGWVDIGNVRVGDCVLSMDEGGQDSFLPVDQVHVSHYCGDLYYYKDTHTEFISTPNHSFPIVTETKNKHGRVYHSPKNKAVSDFSSVVRFPKIGEWKGERIDRFTLQKATHLRKRNIQPLNISGDDFCELIGWVLSEGHTAKRDYAFGISQTKQHNREKIESLLSRCGFRFFKSITGFMVYGFEWYNYMKQFGLCRDKFIPDNIKNAPREQLKIFFDAMMSGDGSGNVYYTTSSRLADDMQEVMHKLGYRTCLRSRNRVGRHGVAYEISYKRNQMAWIQRDKIQTVKYDGLVYCLGIPNVHRFYLRQYGNVVLSGNSWVKQRFIDVCSPEDSYIDPVSGRSRVFIPATVDDNPYLMQNDPDYVKFLDSLPPGLREQWRHGSWDEIDVEGAYFLKQIRDMDSRGQIGRVHFDPVLPVSTYWDLGKNDSNAIWFVQEFGKEARVIDYYEDTDKGLPDYLMILKDLGHKKGYKYGKFFFPHDMGVSEYTAGVGTTRLDTFKRYAEELWGRRFVADVDYCAVPRMTSMQDGIDAVRLVLPYCYFDKEACAEGLRALKNYKKEWDEKHNRYKDYPDHDWSSHGASAFMQFARTTDIIKPAKQLKPKQEQPRYNPLTGEKIR